MATKRQLRGRARGAALVEAAVAIPFFIVIFMGLVFFSKLYIEKQRTISVSRQNAWTYALANCEGNAPSDISQNPDPVPSQAGNDLGDNSKYANGFSGSDTASKSSNMATSTSTGQVTTKERPNTGDQTSSYATVTKKISSKAAVTCNEKPVDGEIYNAITNAWGLLANW